MINAGDGSAIRWASGDWIFLDIGFSNKDKTCGLAFGNDDPICLRFGDCNRRLIEQVRVSQSIVNLVIEAPLSVCFDSQGNPKGRSIERDGGKVRYWYYGPGCAVMVATMYLVRNLHEARLDVPIHLFEGFVSYKSPSVQSNHARDVRWLRDVVHYPERLCDSIWTPDRLKTDPGDVLLSAFTVGAMNYGVPAVIKGTAPVDTDDAVLSKVSG
jgi:hypothetical protein